MVAYRPVLYRGPRYASPALGQTFDEMMGMSPAMGDVLRLIWHGGGTWLGAYIGLKESGFMSVVGWVLAAGMGIAGVLDVVSLIKRAAGTHPPD